MNDIERGGRVGGVFELSNCCGALRWNDTDICIECRDHADFGDNTDEIESIIIDNKKDTL